MPSSERACSPGWSIFCRFVTLLMAVVNQILSGFCRFLGLKSNPSSHPHIQSPESVPDSVVEYSAALLMNISLRTAGRNAACAGLSSDGAPAGEAEKAEGPGSASVAARLLKLCENLIESKNDQVCD